MLTELTEGLSMNDFGSVISWAVYGNREPSKLCFQTAAKHRPKVWFESEGLYVEEHRLAEHVDPAV